jgi:hypothetical protein
MLEHVLALPPEAPVRLEWCAANPGSAAYAINHLAMRLDALDPPAPPLTDENLHALADHYGLISLVEEGGGNFNDLLPMMRSLVNTARGIDRKGQ